jgi:hypothetical protein
MSFNKPGFTEYDGGPTYAPPPPPNPEDEETLDDTVASVIASQWDVGFTEYDNGPAYQPEPTGTDYFNDVPVAAPEPAPTGADYFRNITPQAASDFSAAGNDPFFDPGYDRYVTNEEYFGQQDFSAPQADDFFDSSGFAPGLDTGWFTNTDQQMQWWQQEYSAAVANGDDAKIAALDAELDTAIGWFDSMQSQTGGMQAFNQAQDQYGQRVGNFEQAIAFDPRGEGGFTRLSDGTLAPNDYFRQVYDQSPLNPEYQNALSRLREPDAYQREAWQSLSDESLAQMVQQQGARNAYNAQQSAFLNPPDIALMGGDPDAMQALIPEYDLRNQIAGFGANLPNYWGQGENTMLGNAVGFGLDQAGRAQQAIAGINLTDWAKQGLPEYLNVPQPGGTGAGLSIPQRQYVVPIGAAIPDVTVGDVANGALWALSVGAQKVWQGTTYGMVAVDYAAGKTTGTSLGEYGDESIIEAMRNTYNGQSMLTRVIGESVVDPLNFLGGGGFILKLAKLDEASRTARAIRKVTQSTEQFVREGYIPQATVDRYIGLQPTVSDAKRVEAIGLDVWTSVPESAFAGVPEGDSLRAAFSKQYALERFIDARAGIPNGTPDAWQRTVDQFSQLIEKNAALDANRADWVRGVHARQQTGQRFAHLRDQFEEVASIVLNPENIIADVPVVNAPTHTPIRRTLVVQADNRILDVSNVQPGQMFTPGSGQNRFRATPPRARVTGVPNSPLVKVVYAPGSGRNLPPGFVVSPTTRRVVPVSMQQADTITADVQPISLLRQDSPSSALSNAEQMTLPDAPPVNPSMNLNLPPAPPRATTDALTEIDANQLAVLNFLSTRDQVNYMDQLVSEGRMDSAGINALIDQVNQSSGLARLDQLTEIGRPWHKGQNPADWVNRTAKEAEQHIMQLRRARGENPSSGFMTPQQFLQANPTTDLTREELMLVYRSGQNSQYDVLRAFTGSVNPKTRDELRFFSDESNLPASAGQRRFIRKRMEEGELRLVREGNQSFVTYRAKGVDQRVSWEALSKADAHAIINQLPVDDAVLRSPMNDLMEFGIDLPLNVGTIDDVGVIARAQQEIEIKQRAEAFLVQHLPRMGDAIQPSHNAAGFRRMRQMPTGTSALTPAHVKDWAIRSLPELQDTTFGPVVEKLASALLFVNATGTISSTTAGRYIERGIAALIKGARNADVEEVERLTGSLRTYMHGDVAKRITESSAVKRATQLDPAEYARQQDIARQQIPVTKAALAQATRQLDAGDESMAARVAELTVQYERTLDLANTPQPTPRQRKSVKRAEDAEKVKGLVPQLGDPPVIQTGPEVAGRASTHDIAARVVNGQVRDVPDPQPITPTSTTLQRLQALDVQVADQQAHLEAANRRLTTAMRQPGVDSTPARREHERMQQELATLQRQRQDMAQAAGVGPEPITNRAGVADDVLVRARELVTNTQLTNVHGDRRIVSPTQAANVLGVDEKTAARVLREMEVEGLVGPRDALGARSVKEARVPVDPQRPITATPQRLPFFDDPVGIVAPYMRNRMKMVPLVEPHWNTWKSVDWKRAAPHFEAWAAKHYDPQSLLDEYNGLTLGSLKINPGQLTKMSEVTRAGDLASLAVTSHLDEIMDTDDSWEAVTRLREHLNLLVRGSDEELNAYRNGFFQVPQMRATARLFRKYGAKVLDEFNALLMHESSSQLVQHNIFSPRKAGAWTQADVARLDDMFMKGYVPKGLSPEATAYLDAFTRSRKRIWQETVRPQLIDEAGNWRTTDAAHDSRQAINAAQADVDLLNDRVTEAWQQYRGAPKGPAKDSLYTEATELTASRNRASRDLRMLRDEQRERPRGMVLSTDELDALLFADHGDLPLDVREISERIGGRIASLHGEAIGYDPDKIPAMMKTMQWVKGQLTPLWMTTMLGYHVANMAGNFMAQMMSAALSGQKRLGGLVHTADVRTAVPVRHRRVMQKINEPGTGMVLHPYMVGDGRTSMMREYSLVKEWVRPDGAMRPSLIPFGKFDRWTRNIGIPQALDIKVVPGVYKNAEGKRALGVQGPLTLMEGMSGNIENRFRQIIYSTNVAKRYGRDWPKHLDDLVQGGIINPDQRSALASRMGLKEVRQTLDTAGVQGDARTLVLSRQRQAISDAEMHGYNHTASSMRDYRMRNKVDGMLDKVFPVHFWATKNWLYTGQFALRRPAIAVNAMQVMDAWHDSSENVGLVPIPGEMVPFYSDDLTYHMRVTNIINPAFFAIPKMWELMQTDREQAKQNGGYDDMSVMERLEFWGKNGAENLWASMGYRLGPQWDLIVKGTSFASQTTGKGKDWVDRLNFVASPYVNDYNAEASGGRQPLVPLGGLEDFITSKSERVQGWLRDANKAIYGSPYTSYEVYLGSQEIFRHVAEGDWTEEQALDIAQKMANGEWEDPGVQMLMQGVYNTKSGNWQRNRVIGFSGQVEDHNWKMAQTYNDAYFAARDGDTKRAADLIYYDNAPAALKWMYDERDAGRMTQAQIDKALADGAAGKQSDILKRAVAATETDEWTYKELTQMGATMEQINREYSEIAYAQGDRVARQEILEDYPALRFYWMATGDLEEMGTDVLRSKTIKGAQELRDDYWSGRREDQNAAAPYWARFEKNDEFLQKSVAMAGGDLRLLDMAYRTHSDISESIREDAAAAGVELSLPSDVPREGRNYYGRTIEEMKFLEANGAVEDVLSLERRQAQQGFVLDMVEEQLGLKKYMDDGMPNPEFFTDGVFNEQAWNRAVADAAAEAPAVFNDLIFTLRDEGYDIARGVNGKGITAADFEYHVNRSTVPEEVIAFREQRTADREAAQAEDDPDKRAEMWLDYERKYGSRNTYYGPSAGSDPNVIGPVETFSAAENQMYNENIRSINTWSFTLTPKDRAALREQYPDAFEETTGVDEETGREFTYFKLVPEKLTAEQAQQIVSKNATMVQQNWERGDQMAPPPKHMLPQNETVRRERAQFYERSDEQYVAVTANDEDQRVLRNYSNFVENEGQKVVIYNGTEMTMEEAALAARDDPSATTYSGFQSWKKAISAVGPDTPLGQYMQTRYDLNQERIPVFEKQEEWFFAQPEDVRQILLDENPSKYGKYANGETTSSSSTSTDSYSSGGGGGSSSYSSGSRSSGGSSGYRSSGSTSNGGGYRGQAPTGSTNSYAVVSAADPFFSTPDFVDDGRGMHIRFVSDWMDRMLAVVSMNPNGKGKQWAAWFQGLFMNWLTKHLGPEPTVDSWAVVTSMMRGPAGATPQPEPVAEPAPQQPTQELAMVGY